MILSSKEFYSAKVQNYISTFTKKSPGFDLMIYEVNVHHSKKTSILIIYMSYDKENYIGILMLLF